jgi:hypothetical protein
MKILYNRYTEFGCFSIRGMLEEKDWKVLELGFNTHFKSLEEMTLINLSQAKIPAELIPNMIEFKKTLANITKQKVYIISSIKNLGDFPKFDVFIARFQSQKIRQIARKIVLEDEIYEIETAINEIQEQITALGFDDSSAKKEVQKNITVKTMNKTLEKMIQQFKEREKNLKPDPCEIEDYEIKLKTAIDDLAKATNQPVTL